MQSVYTDRIKKQLCRFSGSTTKRSPRSNTHPSRSKEFTNAGTYRLKSNISVIAPDTLVVAEEFGDWEDSNRSIDLLCIDKAANLVVIELKRTEDGGHMELQAIRYAAMISTLTFEKLIDIYGRYLKKNDSTLDATESVLNFLEWSEPDEERFGQEVKIVLASADFSKEVTTAVIPNQISNHR